jgi:hypothetical protein
VRVSLPKLRRYVRTHGILKTAWRATLAPRDIMTKYLTSVRNNPQTETADEFDLKHGVETTLRVHPTDLDIKSSNWIHAGAYFPTPTGLLMEVLPALKIKFEDFTFVDLGSGKGRIVLLASDFPFREIVGVEFSAELHAAAERNVATYSESRRRCPKITLLCMDFTEFELPSTPVILYLYNPAAEVVIRMLARNIERSLKEHPRAIWIIYVTPRDVFDSEPWLTKVQAGEHSGYLYSIYTNKRAE